jgi:hypothetical protein
VVGEEGFEPLVCARRSLSHKHSRHVRHKNRRNHESKRPNYLTVRPAESPAKRRVGGGTCACCGRNLNGSSGFLLNGTVRCLRCALRYWPMLRRSTATALVVGTILVAINQGAVLVDGTLGSRLLWQIPLTYAVPFCVATWGALSNSRG